MWITTEFTGKVVLQVRDEEEFLAIDSPDCMARYGSIPEILDDGRTIGLALGDTVAFGICPQKETLVAVNVWRVKRPRTQGKPKAAKDEEVRGPLRMLGWAKANKGHYRILCKDLFELYGRDAEIAPEEVPSDLRSGDWISFLVEEPQTSSDALSATDIQVLSKPPAPVPMGDGEDLDAKQLKLSREPALESLGADSSAPSREDTQDLRTPEEWAGAQERLFGHLPALPPKWIRIVGKSTGKEVAVEASAAEQKAEEDGNDPDAYAAAVRESADAVQGIQITDRDKKDKESLEKLKEYQEMVKNDPEAALDKFGGNFVEEWVEERSVKDQVFARFQRFHLLNKNHVLRYQLGGEARWFCQFRQLTEAPTPCSNCGGKRIFECQVQPMLIAQMQGPLRDRLDFGTICVYTCEESCDADAEAACAYIEEFAYVQPEPVAEWIPK
ncbi:unnamed protein product [Durusdinium trenchii]